MLRAGGVKVGNLLPGGGVGCLFKVRVEAVEEGIRAGGDAVALVGRLGAVGGVVLLVEVLEGGEESLRDAVFLVERDGRLDGGVGYEVAVG